ncbi:EAL domain-containing protein [Enterobacter sp. 638]|uniref:EAL domain-containing protein n=1 Tax=Enterobacter sp. (strain 638) TaxID=399742 RepID=UPI0005A252CB|nr:EAL domain-containing protein [Enterobacter sp. 638]
MRSVSREIIGIKLEPIVALSSSRIVGMELLSVLASPEKSEQFFQHQSANQSLMLLETQLAALKNTPYSRNLFINLPITVFVETEYFVRILPLLASGQNIEIVDPHSFLLLSAESRACVTQRLQTLADRGCRIWLDDVNGSLIRSFLHCRLPLSGIKIDKLVFWRQRGTPALAQLVSRCAQVASNVLIEGIESHWDRECALQAGAGFGQGYYWPSVGWSEE